MAADELVDELIAIYTAHPDGFIVGPVPPGMPASLGGPPARRVQEIGRELDRQGGKAQMLRAHSQFAARSSVRGSARNVEIMWDGIGGWRG